MTRSARDRIRSAGLDQLAVALRHRPDSLRLEVAEDERAVVTRVFLRPVDIARRHRHAIFAAVREDRRDIGFALAPESLGKVLEAFEYIPAVVIAESRYAYVFEEVLANIADPQVVGFAVEAESPWHTKSV